MLPGGSFSGHGSGVGFHEEVVGLMRNNGKNEINMIGEVIHLHSPYYPIEFLSQCRMPIINCQVISLSDQGVSLTGVPFLLDDLGLVCQAT